MTAEEATALLHARPFVPFRIHRTDGKSFEVRHPEFVWIFRQCLEIAVLADEAKGIVDHVERCYYAHIVRVEKREPQTAA